MIDNYRNLIELNTRTLTEIYPTYMNIYVEWLDSYTQNGGKVNENTPFWWNHASWRIKSSGELNIQMMGKGNYELVLCCPLVRVNIENISHDATDTIYYWKDGIAQVTGNKVVSLYQESIFDKYEQYAVWYKNGQPKRHPSDIPEHYDLTEMETILGEAIKDSDIVPPEEERLYNIADIYEGCGFLGIVQEKIHDIIRRLGYSISTGRKEG